MPIWHPFQLAEDELLGQHMKLPDQKAYAMELFAALKRMREFEKLQMPFIKSLIDFDIIIEIGYAQEI